MDSLCVTPESSSTGRCKCFEAGRAPRMASPECFLEHSFLGRGPMATWLGTRGVLWGYLCAWVCWWVWV